MSIFNSSKPIEHSVADKLVDWETINSHSSGSGLKWSKALADKLHIEMLAAPQADGNLFVLKMC